jgi:hypothetical protein
VGQVSHAQVGFQLHAEGAGVGEAPVGGELMEFDHRFGVVESQQAQSYREVEHTFFSGGLLTSHRGRTK